MTKKLSSGYVLKAKTKATLIHGECVIPENLKSRHSYLEPMSRSALRGLSDGLYRVRTYEGGPHIIIEFIGPFVVDAAEEVARLEALVAEPITLWRTDRPGITGGMATQEGAQRLARGTRRKREIRLQLLKQILGLD